MRDVGKTSSEVKDRYNKKAYDTIMLRVYKGRKDDIQVAAERTGLSLNAYIVKAIERQMDNDGFSQGGD